MTQQQTAERDALAELRASICDEMIELAETADSAEPSEAVCALALMHSIADLALSDEPAGDDILAESLPAMDAEARALSDSANSIDAEHAPERERIRARCLARMRAMCEALDKHLSREQRRAHIGSRSKQP